MKRININWKMFWILYIGGVIGIIAIFPYASELQKDIMEAAPLPLPIMFLLSVVQGGILLGILLFIGLLLAKKVGLGAPLLEKKLNGEPINVNLLRYVGFSVLLGLVAFLLIVIGELIFIGLGLEIVQEIEPPAWWKGLLASFYGGITEELHLRLFFMTLLVWILSKIKPNQAVHLKVWIAIIVAAIIFGVAHLPAAAAIGDLTCLFVTRTIVLNAIGAIIFGWLYWRQGLEAAIIAHFTADIMLHVILPLVLR